MIKGLQMEVIKRNGVIFETNLYLRIEGKTDIYIGSGRNIEDICKLLKKIKKTIKNESFDSLYYQAKFVNLEDIDELPFEGVSR